MKVLILTGRFGMGHYHVADAVRDDILQKYPHASVSIVDLLEELLPKTSEHIYRSFNVLVRHFSQIYNVSNRIVDRFGSLPMKQQAAQTLTRLINRTGADVLISTFPLCSQYASVFKQLTGFRIPLYTYITDLVVNNEWIAPHTDHYIVGAACTKQWLLSKGIAEISVCGIPVRASFHAAPTHPLPATGKLELLIMGGGLGLIPAGNAFLRTLSAQDDVHITVITGKNEKLRHEIQSDFPSVEAVGYTDCVADYMRRAQLVLTKAGGITTFEAIQTETPLYILKPFLMQEVGNAQYIEQQNIGCVLWEKQTDAAQDVLTLLRNRVLLARMKRNMRALRAGWEPMPTFAFAEGDAI